MVLSHLISIFLPTNLFSFHHHPHMSEIKEDTSDTTVVIKEERDDLGCGSFYGKCKWFSDKSGYGFITVEGENVGNHEENEENEDQCPFKIGKEVFVHFSGIKPINSTYRTLISGEYVFFDIARGTKDFQAVNVTGINGGPLMCDSNPNTKAIFPKSNQTLGMEKKQLEESIGRDGIQDENENDGKIVGQYNGRCKWFNDKSGYGFLVIESGESMGKDVFVHYSGIRPAHGTYKTLVSGEYLTFNVVDGMKDIQAVDVTGYNGGTMMCDINHVPKTSHSIEPHLFRYTYEQPPFYKSRARPIYSQHNRLSSFSSPPHYSPPPSPPPPPQKPPGCETTNS